MSMPIATSSLSESDVPSLQEIFRTAGSFVTERGASDYWLYARLFSQTCIGARKEGRLIGAVIAFRDQSRNFREIYIQDVAVLPDCRGQGVGEAMMRELLRRADQWATGRIWLTSEPENEIAVRLWRKLGFINHQADYIEHGLWVTRDLKGPGRHRVVFALDR